MARSIAAVRSAIFVVFLAVTVIPWGTAAVLYSVVARGERLYWMCAGWLGLAIWGARTICGVRARVRAASIFPTPRW